MKEKAADLLLLLVTAELSGNIARYAGSGQLDMVVVKDGWIDEIQGWKGGRRKSVWIWWAYY